MALPSSTMARTGDGRETSAHGAAQLHDGAYGRGRGPPSPFLPPCALTFHWSDQHGNHSLDNHHTTHNNYITQSTLQTLYWYSLKSHHVPQSKHHQRKKFLAEINQQEQNKACFTNFQKHLRITHQLQGKIL
jgi:hypothetical protein